MKKIFKISKNLIAENLQKKIIWSIIQINLILKIMKRYFEKLYKSKFI